MYIPAFSTKLWFSRIYLFAVFTYKVRHRSGSRAHWKKHWTLFKKNRFSPFKIKLSLSASSSMSKHNIIKRYPKKCKHDNRIDTVVAKNERTIKSYARFFPIIQWWTELQAKRLCNKLWNICVLQSSSAPSYRLPI